MALTDCLVHGATKVDGLFLGVLTGGVRNREAESKTPCLRRRTIQLLLL